MCVCVNCRVSWEQLAPTGGRAQCPQCTIRIHIHIHIHILIRKHIIYITNYTIRIHIHIKIHNTQYTLHANHMRSVQCGAYGVKYALGILN